MNPPAAQKYSHWTNTSLSDTADAWLANAQRHDGSWWPDWNDWVSSFGGEKVAARVPGEGGLTVLEDAPGAYAKLRLDSDQRGTAQVPNQPTENAVSKAASGPSPGSDQLTEASAPLAKSSPSKLPARRAAVATASAPAKTRRPRKRQASRT